MKLPDKKESLMILAICLIAFVLSFTWFIFGQVLVELSNNGIFLDALGEGVLCFLLTDIFGALVVFWLLKRYKIFADDSLLIKIGKIWIITLILFILLFPVFLYINNQIYEGCASRCPEFSGRCVSYCDGPTNAMIVFYLITAAVGIHNPITLSIVGYFFERGKKANKKKM